MALANADLCFIVARSSTLHERIAGPFASAVDGQDPFLAARLERLTQRVAGGDPLRFERYLRAHGWDHVAIARGLGAVDVHAGDLPSWTEILRELDVCASNVDVDRSDDGRSGEAGTTDPQVASPEPFEEALAPFAAVARRRLRARAPASEVVTCRASQAFERGLIRQLAHIAARTLYAEFGAFRLRAAAVRGAADGHHVPSYAHASAIGAAPRDEYDAFIASLRAGGLDRLLLGYPVLARLLSTRVLDWVDSTSEFLQRVLADAPLVAARFAEGRPLGAIETIVPDLSDPHRGGRTVCRVAFACGLTLIYKPRSLAIEAAFSSLLEWCGDGRVTLPPKAPVVLDRGTHGWMECMANEACADPAAVERYYRRAGGLLCLAYVLGGSDLHQGNLIACGEHPVLIDLEAFLGAPMRPDAADGTGHDADGQPIWDSVLRTGLLPVRRFGLRGCPHRDGGFVPIDAGYGRRVPHWTSINTDAMAVEVRPMSTHRLNLPRLTSAHSAAVEDHVDAVIDGFAEIAAALRHSRTELLAPHGALHAFHGVRTRVVRRDTAVYATLLEQALHPRLLRDGAEWSVEFELLEASATTQASRPRAWNAWLAEQHGLARLDVPLFTVRSDRTSIDAHCGEGGGDPGDDDVLVDDYLDESGFDGVMSRIAALDADRTRVQLHSIRLALQPRPSRSPSDRPESPWQQEAPIIAKTLVSIADESNAGRLRWIGIRGLGGSAQRGLQDLGWDLYGGRCGIGLFFAALESRGGCVAERSVATRVLAPMVDCLNAGGSLPTTAWPQGRPALGALGAGGIVYGLTAAAAFLGSDATIDAAARAAEAITPDAIAGDDRLDILSGVAGAALGLLALFEARPRPWLLERAVLCGRHLLQHACRDAASGQVTWRTVDGRIIDGFAHGAAGIAYALARLYRRTGPTAFRDAALAALRVDRTRAASTDALAHSWCQGTAGIGLSRLATSTLVDCPDLREGLDDLLRDIAPPQTGLSRSDQPCCGNVGRIELLSCAADVLGDPRWRDAAHALAAAVIARATQRESYAVSAVDDVFCPGFYQGLAGIGYQWLRFEHRNLPSVMSWE